MKVKRGIEHYQDNIAENYYCAGPLNINRKIKRAVMPSGAELPLDDSEFAVLDMLASCEGEPLAFETLYTAVWGKEHRNCFRDAARLALKKLMIQVRMAGDGFMWIDHSPETGYIFRTRWGPKWWAENELANNRQDNDRGGTYYEKGSEDERG